MQMRFPRDSGAAHPGQCIRATRPGDGMELTKTDHRFELRSGDDLIEVILEPDFHVTMSTMMELWKDVLELGRRLGIHRVLIEGRGFTREMRPIDAYRHGSFLAQLEPPGLRVALCFYDFEPDVVSWMFTRTANAGPSAVEYFRNLDDALRWVRLR